MLEIVCSTVSHPAPGPSWFCLNPGTVAPGNTAWSPRGLKTDPKTPDGAKPSLFSSLFSRKIGQSLPCIFLPRKYTLPVQLINNSHTITHINLCNHILIIWSPPGISYLSTILSTPSHPHISKKTNHIHPHVTPLGSIRVISYIHTCSFNILKYTHYYKDFPRHMEHLLTCIFTFFFFAFL